MKQLTCEMCGSTDLIKQDGLFVCQTCGCKYSVEEAKKMMIEGTVDVSGSTVKVDNTDAIENYMDLARNAIDAGNNSEADSYCNRIIEMDASNWEAWFIKGKAVGWQSSLANIRIPETINAFSKALEYCPEEKRAELAENCKNELERLNTALLSARVKNFKTHPGQTDLKGLLGDTYTIATMSATFILKAGVSTNASFVQYGRIINNGLCDAWQVVLKDYKGDSLPSDDDFRRFVVEGDILIQGFNAALILLGTEYDNEKTNKLIIQVYENMIDLNETIRDASSYMTVDYEPYILKNLSLTADAKSIRNRQIEEWKAKINEVQTIGAEKVAKRRDEYWAEHAEEKAKLEEEKTRLNNEKKQIDSQVQELEKKKEAMPAQQKVEKLTKEIEELTQEKFRLTEEIKANFDRIDDLRKQLSKLGMFKGKEKKVLQSKIDSLETEGKELKQKTKKQVSEIEDRIVALGIELEEAQQIADSQNAEPDMDIAVLRSRLESISARISDIDSELNMDR